MNTRYGLQNNISMPLVFIDGIARCGKTALSAIIPTLTKMEHIHLPDELELIIPGVALGGVDSDYAKSFLRIYFNQLSYNCLIGRKVNFRPGDLSGADNYHTPSIYYDRLNKEDGDCIVEACLSTSNSLPLLTHDLLVNFHLVNKLLENFKIIELWRNPIENIYSWWSRGWGIRYQSDPRVSTLLVDVNEFMSPWYAQGTSYTLSVLNPMERCVVTATDLLHRAVKQYSNSPYKHIVHNIRFESLCIDPLFEMNNICIFLGVEETIHTKKMLARERFPRKIDHDSLNKKLYEIRDLVRPAVFDLLVECNKSYEENLYGLSSR